MTLGRQVHGANQPVRVQVRPDAPGFRRVNDLDGQSLCSRDVGKATKLNEPGRIRRNIDRATRAVTGRLARVALQVRDHAHGLHCHAQQGLAGPDETDDAMRMPGRSAANGFSLDQEHIPTS